jgi:PAS domain S-box-containing protein
MSNGPVDIGDVRALAFRELEDGSGRAKGVDPGKFRAQQIAAVKRTTPHMMLANIMAAVMVSVVAWETSAAAIVLLWAALMTGVSTYILISGMDRFKPKPKRGRPFPVKLGPRATRKANVYAGMLGLIWALLPASTFGQAPHEVSLIIMGVVMGACGLGAFSLSRIPSAALIFASLVTAALAGSSFLLGGSVGIAAAVLGLIYGIALAAMILQSHQKELRRVHDELELESQNEIIKLLLREFESGTKDWLWETDANGKLTYASERLAQLAGKKHERILGATLVQAVSAKPAQQGWTRLMKAAAERVPMEQIEVPVRSSGKMTWWEVNANPVFDEAGEFKGYRGVAVDVTRSREHAAQLLKAKKVAERANLSKSQFLAMMSHELRTPLNSIVGYAELIITMMKNQNTRPDFVEYAQNISDQGNHLNELIGNILDVTRLERGKVELVEQEVALEELVDIVVKTCRLQASAEDICLSYRIEMPDVLVKADLTRLKQILINLTSNAIKFTPARGSVEIVVGSTDKGAVTIAVKDTGIGIEQSKIDAMFEPFVQAEGSRARRYDGAGLGLAISRELARMHGGEVMLESAVGKGTTATLILPCHRMIVNKDKKTSCEAAA